MGLRQHLRGELHRIGIELLEPKGNPAPIGTADQGVAQETARADHVHPYDSNIWTNYTPTLTQSATVTKTITYARYKRIGRLITVNVLLLVTGAGTGANGVLIGLPFAAATNDGAIGVGFIYDSSANLLYKGIVDLNTTTVVDLLSLHSTSSNILGAVDFTAALAVNDVVSITVNYESAS